MKSHLKIASQTKNIAAALGLLFLTSAAYADDPLSMAPPIPSAVSQAEEDGGTVSAAQDSVFNWAEVPQDQEIPIRRAVFDQGGYQLYDEKGETIVVPFTNQNLYVMKFARSTTGSFYFVNEGSAPVLYVPENGFLDNASVPGAHWYPFSEEFHPSHPVFLGIAPSYTSFISMGWYPGMYCHGGYWGETSFISGGDFQPSVGLFIVIGDHHYYGWNHYHDYYYDHPAPYHVGYYHRDVYRWADHPSYDRGRSFGGGDRRPDGPHTFGYGRTFGNDHRTFGNDHRTFGGGVRSYQSDHAGNGGHVFQGGRPTAADGGHSYSGSRTYGTQHPYDTQHTYGGGHVFGGTRSSDSSPAAERHGTFSGASHSFGGGYTRSTEGSGHSNSSDSRSYSGEDRSSSHGSDRSSGQSGGNVHSGRSSGNDHSSQGGGNHFGGRSRR